MQAFNNDSILSIGFDGLAFIYLPFICIVLLLHFFRVTETLRIFVASLRMSVQLILAGFILEVIFQSHNLSFVLIYLALIMGFAIWHILSKNPELNRSFKCIIVASLSLCGLSLCAYFLLFVVGSSLFIPQYVIPLFGMMMGNAMNGIETGLQVFKKELRTNQEQILVLSYFGVFPSEILKPFIQNAMQIALIPTINAMLSMGVIMLPGMMAGQILSGTPPSTAVLYQIAILIAQTSVVMLSLFLSLKLGSKTLVDMRQMIQIP